MRGPLRAPAVRWLALAGPAPDALAAALLGLPGADAKLEPMREDGGREGVRAMRARLGSGEVLFAKLFPAPPRGRLLQALVHGLRGGAAQREWRALRELDARGVPVPEPRAIGRLPGGTHLLVTGFCAGPSLAAALAAGAHGRALAAGAHGRALAAGA